MQDTTGWESLAGAHLVNFQDAHVSVSARRTWDLVMKRDASGQMAFVVVVNALIVRVWSKKEKAND